MSRRTGITDHTAAEIQAGTSIDAQVNDQIRITDLGTAPGRIFYCVSGNGVADDGQYTLVEAAKANQWRSKEEVSALFASSVSVPYSALQDALIEDIAVNVPGIVEGEAYLAVAIPATLPDGTDLELQENHETDTLNFTFENNSGQTLVAGNITINVYKI